LISINQVIQEQIIANNQNEVISENTQENSPKYLESDIIEIDEQTVVSGEVLGIQTEQDRETEPQNRWKYIFTSVIILVSILIITYLIKRR